MHHVDLVVLCFILLCFGTGSDEDPFRTCGIAIPNPLPWYRRPLPSPQQIKYPFVNRRANLMKRTKNDMSCHHRPVTGQVKDMAT